MAFGSFNSNGAQAPMAEINTTPLVDVMLVLLIIFIITAPLMTHSVRVELPRATSTPTPDRALILQVSISADAVVSVNGDPFSGEVLETRFRHAVMADRNVELHLMADRAVRYEAVAQTMSAARRAGVAKIGFVTQPGADTP